MAIGRKLKDVASDINVTPMVDVMLVLLIIFMVVTPMLQKGVSVDLAKSVNPRNMPDADKEDADARAKFDTVVKAVDEVRSAGVDQLGLLTEKVEEKARRLAL
jgi:biopolymer transport protein TolR